MEIEQSISDWNINLIYRCEVHDQVFEIRLEGQDKTFHAWLDGEDYQVEFVGRKPGQIDLRIQGLPVRLYWFERNGSMWISYQGCNFFFERPERRSSRKPAGQHEDGVSRAPMPAQVRSIEVQQEDIVTRGDTIMLLEAMKMEIRITAPINGKVSRIHVSSGQRVDQGQLLFEINPLNLNTETGG